MDENINQPDDPKTQSPLNKQMSPLAGGAFFGVVAFAWILYKHHDIARASMIGAVAFAAGFAVMFLGMALERRNKAKP
jgi:hypothetical protein